ncbi:sirtuin 2 [Tanacetum coccineum]
MPGSFPGSAKYVQTMPLPEDTVVSKDLVPDSDPLRDEDVNALCDFFDISTKLVVLTGAGISTECGIPDYRSRNGAYSTGFEPMTYQKFMTSIRARKRCWAYSYPMWRKFKEAKPGPAHTALASLEKANRISLIITQNIDGLHHRVGSNACDIHGTVHIVTCVNCGFCLPRDVFEDRMNAFNPEWEKPADKPDLIVSENNYWDKVLHLPTCSKCNGVLTPDARSNHGNVSVLKAVLVDGRIPEDRYYTGNTQAKFILWQVIGLAAEEAGATIAIVNIGETSCDDIADLKIDAQVGEILPRVLEKLGVPDIGDFDMQILRFYFVYFVSMQILKSILIIKSKLQKWSF